MDLPPLPPRLRSTPSMGYSSSGSRAGSGRFGTTEVSGRFGSGRFKTKLQLVVNSLTESVIPAAKKKGAKLRVISFNNTASLFEGTMDAVSNHVKTFYPNGGTNFEDVFKILSENRVQEREIVILLTDGFDSDKDRRDKYLTNPELKGTITSLVAIGNAQSIDVNFLNHLSGGLAYTFSTNQDEISDAIKALCFSGFNSVRAENIEFTFWCQANGVFFPTDSNVSYEHVDTMDETEYPFTSLFSFDYGKNGINILSTKSSPDKEEEITVTFCVDTSSSMAERINSLPPVPIHTSSQAHTTGFIKIKVKSAMIDDLYRLFWKGIVLKATVSYTDTTTKINVIEKIPFESIYSEKTFEVGFQALRILRGLTTNTPVDELYKDNMNFLTTLEDIPEFMKMFSEKIYESLQSIRRSQMRPYERFMDQAPPTMTRLVHTLSAGASDRCSDLQRSTHNTECSICMSKEVSMIALPCKHTGSCAVCFEKAFETKPVCPFCRDPYENVIKIDSLKCECGQPANRIGTNVVEVEKCGHALACEKTSCRKEKEGKLYCKVCDDFVDSFKIFYC